jgi:hypothetical protein
MPVTALHRHAQNDNPELPSFTASAYAAMAPRWKICREVDEGTEALRRTENLDTYFPKGAVESDPERLSRVNRAELFPMLKDTVKGLVGLALRKSPTLGKDVPATIVKLWENIDGAGTHGTIFLKRVFRDGILKGHSGVLVDVPKVSTEGVITTRRARELGLRPYAVHVKPEQVINWRTQVINGSLVLTLLVIMEEVDAPSGRFGTQTVTRYRIFVRDEATGLINYEVWTQSDEAKDPEFENGGVLQATTRVPYAVVYCGERIAALQSLPPLLDLAYTNIAHVQVLSDHRTALHAGSNPILCTKNRTGGVPTITPDPNKANVPGPSDMGGSEGNPAFVGDVMGRAAPPLLLGVNTGIDVGKDGDVWYAEPTGASYAATDKELENIETRGAAQGLSMLQRDRRAAETAEAERLQRTEKDAALSTAAHNLKDMAETMLAFFALFLGETTGGSIVFDFGFEEKLLTAQQIDVYSRMVGAGQLTRRTMWKMILSELPDDFDADAEEAALQAAEAIVLENMNADGGAGGGGGGGSDGGSTAKSDTGSGAPQRESA